MLRLGQMVMAQVMCSCDTRIAAEARTAIRAATGLRCSAGVVHEPLLAKLASPGFVQRTRRRHSLRWRRALLCATCPGMCSPSC
mmetsp:Transcript_7602/g.18585  ORF Transcript_7602/g.18585 Transcript_7602/m.18585 type:complete len:84 (+) Transcript_7602:522-773(+)